MIARPPTTSSNSGDDVATAGAAADPSAQSASNYHSTILRHDLGDVRKFANLRNPDGDNVTGSQRRILGDDDAGAGAHHRAGRHVVSPQQVLRQGFEFPVQPGGRRRAFKSLLSIATD